MIEGLPKPESEPAFSVYDIFERFVERGEWNKTVEDELNNILETHPDDLYMIYLTYLESGIADDELPAHERSMYEWLAKQFEGLE